MMRGVFATAALCLLSTYAVAEDVCDARLKEWANSIYKSEAAARCPGYGNVAAFEARIREAERDKDCPIVGSPMAKALGDGARNIVKNEFDAGRGAGFCAKMKAQFPAY